MTLQTADGWAPFEEAALATAEQTEGATVLEAVHAFIGRFVAYPSREAHTAHALWIAHAHLMEAWESTPRLAFLSPEPGSGKSRALEITELLVPRPILTVNATPAFVFRRVADEAGLPTILADEIDTVFGPKARENEELRGFYNAGHRRGAVAGRCVVKGKVIETEELPAYCAVALAGLGNLPDTILTRCVIVKMRRRAPGETVEPFRRRVHGDEGEALRGKLAAWAIELESVAGQAWPDMPPGIADRAADVWEPLLTVADLAGGAWPERARVAAVSLVADTMGGQGSLGLKLLSDIREAFDDATDILGARLDQLPTAVLLEKLNGMEESPWGDLKGKPLDSRKLARLLATYEIKPTTIRTGTGTPKGYRREAFHDAWVRYLPNTHVEHSECSYSPSATQGCLSRPPYEGATAATDATCQRCAGVGCEWCER
jgi:hypothetical protein